jgi:hypothetical protein
MPIKQSADLFRLLNRKTVGDVLEIEILRGDEKVVVEVRLEDGEPEPEPGNNNNNKGGK